MIYNGVFSYNSVNKVNYLHGLKIIGNTGHVSLQVLSHFKLKRFKANSKEQHVV